MKKIGIIGLLLIMLVGCSVEESPENYFDIALTEIEEKESYQTEVTLKDEQQTLCHYKATYANGQVIIEGASEPWMEKVATFNYSDVYTDFAYQNDEVTCLIPLEDSEVFSEMLKNYTTEAIESITHTMSLDQLSLTRVTIQMETKTQTYYCTIEIL